MALYMRFMMTLTVGLAGVGLVLKVLLDGLFNEWDVLGDLNAAVRGAFEHRRMSDERAEDVMLEIEKSNAPKLNTRLIEQRREQLKEIDAVEHRLRLPSQPIVLTPLPPPSAQPPAEETAEAVWK